MTTAIMTPQGLKDWVHETEVCFEIAPHYDFYRQSKLCAGLDLLLFAKRPPLCRGGDPGCPACAGAFHKLRMIALHALPPGLQCEFGPFDASFHLRPETNWKAELELVVEITGPDGARDPTVRQDRPLAGLISDALESLGAQARVWSGHQGSRPGSSRAPAG